MEKRIVIVGAGYAGILTAKKLAKRLKKRDDVSITIIDKNPYHTMLTELHEVAANRVDEESIKISLKKVFAGRRVEVKLDKISSVDFNTKKVIGEQETYPYDYLVLAAGSKPAFYGVTGAEENTFKLWSFDDAILLREHIHDCFRAAACERNEKERKKLLTFYVVGAGFTGVEMVGELAEYVPFLCEKHDINPKDVTLINVDGLPRPIPSLPEKLSDKVVKRLTKMGVQLEMDTFVSEVGEDFIELKQNGKLNRYPSATVIWAAGIQSTDVTQKAGETLTSQNGGRIEVDQYLRSVKDESVYVIGDNMYYIAPNEERPVPQMVENCEQSSAIAAHNIANEINGKDEKKEYEPKFHGVMVSIGGRYAVCHVGLPGHFFSMPSFLAMFSKHFINIIYFIQVLGWNKVFSYAKHEFFTIRNRRSFVGGHLSNRTPSFLLMPLRVWLGAVWVFEGVKKISEGWMKSPKLKGFFHGADAWYDSILGGGSSNPDAVSSSTSAVADTAVKMMSTVSTGVTNFIHMAADAVSGATGAVTDAVAGATGAVADAVSGATGAADAVSGATGAVSGGASSVGEVLVNFNIFGLLRILFVSGKDLAHSSLSDMAVKLDIPLMDWFVNNVILSGDGIQMFMQIFIVVAEILLGLALIGGLFTTPAAAFSLILQMMFVCTTGLYLGTVWMVVAAVAVLIGAGRTLGLDYYAMPWLKKVWKKIPFVKKWYIYND